MRMRAALPEQHLSTGAENAVKLAAGLVATMAALVLGLLLASADNQYNANSSVVTQMAARIVLLDQMLSAFGTQATQTREDLRHSFEAMRNSIWPDAESRSVQLDPSSSGSSAIYGSIESLSPQNDVQRSLKPQLLEKAIELGQMRWLLYEQAGNAVSTPLLVVVVCWLAVIFFSYGLFAPANGTVITMLMVAALSVSGAMFLIMELDTPFGGLIQISSRPVDSALSHLGR